MTRRSAHCEFIQHLCLCFFSFFHPLDVIGTVGNIVPLRLFDCFGLLVVGFVAGWPAVFFAGEGGDLDGMAGGGSRIADGDGILMFSIPGTAMTTWAHTECKEI